MHTQCANIIYKVGASVCYDNSYLEAVFYTHPAQYKILCCPDRLTNKENCISYNRNLCHHALYNLKVSLQYGLTFSVFLPFYVLYLQ